MMPKFTAIQNGEDITISTPYEAYEIEYALELARRERIKELAEALKDE